jgi:nucleoside 2-deoxyribosyltransferase
MHCDDAMTLHDYDVFISYARNDGVSYAERLERDLPRMGFRTWRDKRLLDPNQDFTAELERGIERSAQVICLITPDTRRDDSFVRREIAYALALGKPIIPLIFQDTLPPIHIINVTHVDFTRQAWASALGDLRQRLAHDLSMLQTGAFTPPQDPFRDYLNVLYKQIIAYLNQTVFALASGYTQQDLIHLKTLAADDAVDTGDDLGDSALPLAFFDMAGLKTEPDFRDFAGAFTL